MTTVHLMANPLALKIPEHRGRQLITDMSRAAGEFKQTGVPNDCDPLHASR